AGGNDIATGGISIDGNVSANASPLGSGGRISLIGDHGPLSIGGTINLISAAGGQGSATLAENGGSITLMGTSYTNSALVTLDVHAGGIGNGGSVVVRVSGPTADLDIGT